MVIIMENWINVVVTVASLLTAVTVILDKGKKVHKKINQPEETATELAELKRQHKEETEKLHKHLFSLENGLLVCLHDRLYFLCNFYLVQGWLTVEELKNLEHLYIGYSGLGGNGTCKELYERCCGLPINN